MILKECIMTGSSCYQRTSSSDKTGIVVHSTGCNNKTIKRYVQPLKSDESYAEIIADIGVNELGNDWNHIEVKKGVHAWIGENANGIIETYVVLPYEKDAWGVGNGDKGSFNYAPTSRINFEICEDDLSSEEHFNKSMKEAQEYCAYLCRKFSFDTSMICSHAEAHKLGYGSNHADPDHWLRIYGKDMDWFRSEVKKLLDK